MLKSLLKKQMIYALSKIIGHKLCEYSNKQFKRRRLLFQQIYWEK